MSEDTVNDLKQFITTTVSQQISDLAQQITDLDTKMSNGLAEVRQDISNLSEQVADTFVILNDDNESRFKKLERRVTRLEHKTTA